MRNEYTDYIAHGHKYFAVVDLGKKNSNGSKRRRYFYSANEYKAYLQGKKTTDDKLLGAASKVANKLSGVKAIGKGLASTAKAIRNTDKKVKSYKEQGMTEEEARNEIKKESTYSTIKRAGLTPSGYKITMKDDSGKEHNVVEAKNSRGKRFYVSEGSRHAAYEGKNSNLASATKAAKKAANSAGKKGVGDLSTSISEQRGDINKERHEKNKANLKAHPEKSILNNPIREHLVERLVEKGITKAKAEKLRDTIKSTIGNATALANAADKINKKVGGIQDALLSGDSEKLYDEMNDLMENAEENQKEMEQIYKSIPIFGTFLEAAEKQNEKFDAEWQKKVDASNKERSEKEAEWNKKSAEFEEAKKKIAEATDNIMSNRNDVSVLVDSTKKTLDTATAGPKAIADDVDEYLKEHGMTKEGVSKEFLDELRENLKRNRK